MPYNTKLHGLAEYNSWTEIPSADVPSGASGSPSNAYFGKMVYIAGATPGAITLSATDVQLGAIELKDGDTDARAKVNTASDILSSDNAVATSDVNAQNILSDIYAVDFANETTQSSILSTLQDMTALESGGNLDDINTSTSATFITLSNADFAGDYQDSIIADQLILSAITPGQITSLAKKGYMKLRISSGGSAYIGTASVTTSSGYLLDDFYPVESITYDDLSIVYAIGSGTLYSIGGYIA